MSENGFRISFGDEDIAELVYLVADKANPNWSRDHREDVLAAAVKIGRALGRRLPLEPLDAGLRTVAAAAADELSGSGLAMVDNLRRLDRFLQRYPNRGVADTPETGS